MYNRVKEETVYFFYFTTNATVKKNPHNYTILTRLEINRKSHLNMLEQISSNSVLLQFELSL